MVTQKRLLVPIFSYKVQIVICDTFEELSEFISDTDIKGYVSGVTLDYGNGTGMVGIVKNNIASIAHESFHLTNNIWNFIGYIPQRDNDEVSAYLLTYLYEKIESVYNKHIGGQ